MASVPPRSRRGKILVNLQRQLETISIANGYASDVYKVTTDVKSWQATPETETPVIYIIDENTDYNYHAGKTTEREWTIGIYGVMKNKEQTDMEELIADVEECLFNNVTLSFDSIKGPISHLRILNITTDNQFFSEIEGSQLFKMTIVFRYIACVDNIR